MGFLEISITATIRNSVDEFNRFYPLRLDQSQESIENVASSGKMMGGTEEKRRRDK